MEGATALLPRPRPRPRLRTIRLRDGQADALFAGKNLAADSLFHPLWSELQDAGQADDHAGAKAVHVAGAAQPRDLLVRDLFVEVVELLLLDAAQQRAHQVQVIAGAQARG